MFRSLLKTLNVCYMCSNSSFKIKVVVCGAAGKVGELVSLFLKQSSLPMKLALYDISPSLSHVTKQLACINMQNTIESYMGPVRLRAAIKDADIVLLLVRSNHYSKTLNGDSFETNFPVVATIVKTCIEVSPSAILAIATNPINSIVPAVEEIYRNFDLWYANKIIGITSADSMQACSIYAEMFSMDPNDVFVPIAGGTTVETIVPLFSQGKPAPRKAITREEAEKLTNIFMDNKSRATTSKLAAAFAIFRFVESLARALSGEKNIVECGFVSSSANASLKYMTSLIDLGEDGIANVYGLTSSVSRYERKQLQSALYNLQRDFTLVEKYLNTSYYKISDKIVK